jgi:hypothetical protein
MIFVRKIDEHHSTDQSRAVTPDIPAGSEVRSRGQIAASSARPLSGKAVIDQRARRRSGFHLTSTRTP